mmetsp:Transcript_30252/g.90092  ORF Transcript_30252/g.90092 Transcript_30252/m.90092 type:complete len:297 (-) Transcript_30252:834-1724(-)
MTGFLIRSQSHIYVTLDRARERHRGRRPRSKLDSSRRCESLKDGFAQLSARGVEIVVDDHLGGRAGCSMGATGVGRGWRGANLVEAARREGELDLLPGAQHSPRNLLLRLGAALRQTLSQRAKRRRRDPHAIWPQVGASDDRLDALHVDVEHADLALGCERLHRRDRRAVPVAADGRPFDELAALHHRVELARRHEPVVLALHLAFARVARRRRDGETEAARLRLQQRGDESRLADAGRAGEHQLLRRERLRPAAARVGGGRLRLLLARPLQRPHREAERASSRERGGVVLCGPVL